MPSRVLYAALMISSGTINELKESLARDFFWLLDSLAEPPSSVRFPNPTPGPVFGSL